MIEQDLTATLRQRSSEQAAMTALMLKIKAEEVRYIAVETLGKKNEKEALLEASKYLTKARHSEIVEALQEIESIKGKKYVGNPPFAGIVDSLLQGGITCAELPVWVATCKKTTFASGHRYQPLPSHDEAWQTYSKVHTELYPKRRAAESVKYRTTTVALLDNEVIHAAEWGFWSDMSNNLKRRLFLLLPQEKQRSIRNRLLPPEQAMQETRAHYDKMMEVFQ
ncbi:MAG: hypothetical protein WCL42_08300 [Chlorobiaceae bacterium]